MRNWTELQIAVSPASRTINDNLQDDGLFVTRPIPPIPERVIRIYQCLMYHHIICLPLTPVMSFLSMGLGLTEINRS